VIGGVKEAERELARPHSLPAVKHPLGPLGGGNESVSPLPCFTSKLSLCRYLLPVCFFSLASFSNCSFLPPRDHNETAVDAVTGFTCFLMCVGVGVGWSGSYRVACVCVCVCALVRISLWGPDTGSTPTVWGPSPSTAGLFN